MKKEWERKKKNIMWFRCPKTGSLCSVEDPTEKQKQMRLDGKLTAYKLLEAKNAKEKRTT